MSNYTAEYVGLKLAAKDTAWIDYTVQCVSVLTTSGSLRLPLSQFRFFIGCASRLGYVKDKATGSVARREKWKGLTSKQYEALAKTFASVPVLHQKVAEMANKGVTVPVFVKPEKAQKEAVSSEDWTFA